MAGLFFFSICFVYALVFFRAQKVGSIGGSGKMWVRSTLLRYVRLEIHFFKFSLTAILCYCIFFISSLTLSSLFARAPFRCFLCLFFYPLSTGRDLKLFTSWAFRKQSNCKYIHFLFLQVGKIVFGSAFCVIINIQEA